MHKLFACLAFALTFGLSHSAISQSVDPLTGRAVVSIPLGSMSAYDLGVTVSLSHHGGALRVSESSGNAGMGWQVGVGGYSITREVRGLPDDVNTSTRKGWLYNSNASTIQGFAPTANDDLTNCTDESTDWTFINGRDFANDTEPDIFYFNAPGVSGKFVFGSNGLPQLIPYQDLSISFSSGNFTITTANGVVYNFNNKRTMRRETFPVASAIPYFRDTYGYYLGGLTFTSTWDLSTVTSKITGAVMTYAYSGAVTVESTNYKTIVYPSGNGIDTLYKIKENTDYTSLSTISLKNYQVAFTWAGSLVDRVTISESESQENRIYNLVYKSYSSTVGSPIVWKSFLTKVIEQRNCVNFPPYEFQYVKLSPTGSTIDMPWGDERGKDLFGYFKGEASYYLDANLGRVYLDGGNKNVPTVYFYSSESGARRLRATPIPGATATTILSGVDSRNVNSSYNDTGALQKIIYPTGGVTTFAYEPNKYWDSSTSEELDGPGIRVASITTTGGEYSYGSNAAPDPTKYHSMKKTYEYKITDNGRTSGNMMYPPVYSFIGGTSIYRTVEDMGPPNELMYSRVKEIVSGMGSTVYIFDVPSAYPSSSPIVPQSKIARKSGDPCNAGLMQNGVYTFPFAPTQDLDYKRGLLRKVLQYSEAGTLVGQRRINYTEPQASSTVRGLRFDPSVPTSSYFVFHYSVYDIPVNQSKITATEVVTTVTDMSPGDSLHVTKSYTYNAKNRVIQSTTTNDDGSVLNSYVKYAEDYNITSPTGGDLQAIAINKLNSSATSRQAEVIETWQTFTPIGGSAVVTSAALNLFKDNGTFVWPNQSKVLPQGKSFTQSAVIPGGTQGFSSDSDYLLDGTVEYVDALPVNQTGTSQVTSSTHYSIGTGLPVASFVNCKAENAVYEGFESMTTHGLTGGTATNTGWTGIKAMPISNTVTLTSGSVTKSENAYRISLWAYATTSNITISVKAKVGGTVQATTTLNYPTANQWTYLEGTMNTTSVSSTFTLEVSSPTAITIDDFIAIPQSARVSSKTFLPLTGPTSETDDRGNSTTISYDLLGRPTATFDRKRNLVGLTEYSTQISNAPELKALFLENVADYQIDAPTTFNAATNCVTGATYLWTFTNPYGYQTTASGVTVVKTFTVIGPHIVSLAVSKAGFTTQTHTETICVRGTDTPGVDVTVTRNGSQQQGNVNQIIQCDAHDDGVRIFTATLPGVPHGGQAETGPTVIYTWYITNASGVWQTAASYVPDVMITGNVLTVNGPSWARDYQVRCDVRYELQSPFCDTIYVLGSGQNYIDYQSNPICP